MTLGQKFYNFSFLCLANMGWANASSIEILFLGLNTRVLSKKSAHSGRQ